MHPLLKLLISQPGLLGEHAQGYAELLASDFAAMKAAGQRRLVWGVGAALLAFVGVLLGGVALMLWAALPGPPEPSAWVLWATPLVLIVASCACWQRMQALDQVSSFSNLQEQIKADMQLLHEISAP